MDCFKLEIKAIIITTGSNNLNYAATEIYYKIHNVTLT